MLLCAIQIILALVVLGVAVVAAYIWMQGDAKMVFDVKKRTAVAKVSETDKRLDFAVELDYKNVGKQEATLIDDITGTMPPYDKHIVYGPSNPTKVAEEITKATGSYGAAIADVNDLKRSAVLGVSKGVDADKVAEILIDNPFGNGSEKTPICIIKDYYKA